MLTADTRASNRMQIENGRVKLASGTDSVIVYINTRLGTEATEWLYDNTVGLPYYSDGGFFSGDMTQDEMSAIMRREVLGVYGVIRINDYSFGPLDSSREKPVNMNITVADDAGVLEEIGVTA